MSGHNKWSTIKHKKGKADAIRGRVFTKVIREITLAARVGGGDPDANAQLRKTLLDAKAANMPKHNIERAIAKGTGELEGVSFHDITYEGYGPNGVAVLVDVVTDNRNRTVAEVRHIFSKYGGKTAEPNSVAYLFEPQGQITLQRGDVPEDEMMLLALDAGANDVEAVEGEDGVYSVTTDPTTVWTVRDALEEAGFEIEGAEIAKVAATTIELGGGEAATMLRMVDAFDDNDDVQRVWANFDLDEAALAEMENE